MVPLEALREHLVPPPAAGLPGGGCEASLACASLQFLSLSSGHFLLCVCHTSLSLSLIRIHMITFTLWHIINAVRIQNK